MTYSPVTLTEAQVINDLIAMRVMNWHIVQSIPPNPVLEQWADASGQIQQWRVSYDPTTDLRYAQKVIEQLSYRFSLFIEIHENTVYIKFINPITKESFGNRSPISRLSLAICVVALKAIGNFPDQIPPEEGYDKE